jgi:hypothetical protein
MARITFALNIKNNFKRNESGVTGRKCQRPTNDMPTAAGARTVRVAEEDEDVRRMTAA